MLTCLAVLSCLGFPTSGSVKSQQWLCSQYLMKRTALLIRTGSVAGVCWEALQRWQSVCVRGDGLTSGCLWLQTCDQLKLFEH